MNKKTSLAAVAFVALLMAPSVFAASDHVEGVISARSNETFTVGIAGGTSITVVLTETTKIRLNQTPVHASELIPGLEVKVKGSYNASGQLVADEVSFGHSEQRTAKMIKGGLATTREQVETDARRIDVANANIEQHGQTLDQHAREIAFNDAKMVATTGRLGSRIDSLDDYSVVEKLIVYFENGKATVQPRFVGELEQFAAKAKERTGYRIQVQGYASAIGPRAFNEALSDRRAGEVTAVLHRAGVPPVNILVPAAMGVSEQFGENKTAKGQAENRRVIVTLLQSKGMTEK